MIGLGIECTAHTLGIGIVKNGKIIANEKDSYVTERGGIIPSEAAKHHEKVFEFVLGKALDKASISLQNLDFISLSIGPGLSPCLLVGLRKTKELALKLKKPVVPVNHCIAHLEVGKITGSKNPVMLYVSGANTQVIAYSSGKYRIFGETLDIGVGNFIDNFARFLGIGFPGGPRIQKIAEQGKKFIELPYTVKGMDIALSGILTNLKQKVEEINKRNLHSQAREINFNDNMKNSNDSSVDNSKLRANENEQMGNLPQIQNQKILHNEQANYTKEDLAYSMQETVFAMLVEVAERALAYTGKTELLLGGGVACNSRLRDMAKKMCGERLKKTELFVPDNSLLVDNGAMIAFAGEILFKSGIKTSYKSLDELDIKPRQRTDDVEVSWR